MNFSKQVDFILEGYNQVGGMSSVTPNDFEFIASQWELSDEQKRIVGEEGRISFPYTLSNQSLDSEKRWESRRLLRQIDSDFSDTIHPYDARAKIRNNENLSKEECNFLTLVSEKSSYYYGESFEFSKNKVVAVMKDEVEDIHGVLFATQKRRTLRKTLEKFYMDLYKEFYPVFKKLYENELSRLYSAITKAEQFISNAYEESGTMYISALPEDIITASHNNRNWDSCFAPEGDWCLSPYNYLRNNNTLIAFFISDKHKNRRVDWGELETFDKEWRTFIFITKNGNVVFSTNQYPFYSTIIKEDLAKFIISRAGGNFDMMYGRISREGDTYWDGGRGIIYFGEHPEESKSYDIISDENTISPESGNYVGDSEAVQFGFVDPENLDMISCDDCGDWHHSDSVADVRSYYGYANICESCLEYDLDDGRVETCQISGEYFYPNAVDYVDILAYGYTQKAMESEFDKKDYISLENRTSGEQIYVSKHDFYKRYKKDIEEMAEDADFDYGVLFAADRDRNRMWCKFSG